MQEQKPQKPIIIEVGSAPIDIVIEAFFRLGYDYEAGQCLENTAGEMEKGGVWIVASDQEQCSKGVAYKFLIEPERADELKAVVRLTEALYEYLSKTLPEEYSPRAFTPDIISAIRDKIDELLSDIL